MINLLPTVEPRYLCPGETHSISRAVHLSRLAAFYPKCRDCSHRCESGQLPQLHFPPTDAPQAVASQRSLFTLEGIRGVYLNELTRQKAGEFAAAFAHLLWNSLPLSGRSDLRDANSKRPTRRSGPVVVVAFDERPSSPDLVTGVAAALRRMSCQVVDIGQTSVPCFRFAVAHMQAAGGIMITGHGCEPSWTGLDFVGKHGRPISAAGRRTKDAEDTVEPHESARSLSLDDLHEQHEQGTTRPLRQGGTQRVFQASTPYLAGLVKQFHALRPLHITIGCPVRSIRRTLDALFEKLPVTLHWVDVPQRRRDLQRDDDADVQRVRESVIAQQTNFGFLIDDNGANVAVLDDLGELIGPEDLLCLIADLMLSEQSNGAIVIDNASRDRLQPRLSEQRTRCWLGGWTQAEMWQTLRQDAAVCGGGASGRLWLRDTHPVTDAILTLAKLLQLLSQDDVPLSQRRAISSS